MCTKKKRRIFRPGRLALMVMLLSLALPATARAQESAAEAYQKAYELVLDEKWSQANDALQDFMDQFSRSDWADDAQFWWCYVEEKTGRFDEDAFDCYQDFVEDYPRSKYADDARGNMVQLAQRLARSGKREYLTIVESMREAGDEDVKLAALDALWQMGDERALDAVLDLYDSSGSERFRKKVIFALSQFDDPKAAEKLKDIALQDPNPTIRKEAIFWISQRGDAEVIPLLEEIAKADDSYEVQKQIIFAYSQLGRDGVPQLIRLARGHSDPDIQKEAIFWLGQTGGREVIAFFDELINSSDNVEVQKSLVFALSKLEDEGVPRLIDIARTHQNPDIRKEAFFWISQEGGPQAARFFEERLDAETDVDVLKQLVFALSQLDDEGVPGLIKAAKTHESQQVRKDAIFWLGQSDDARARDALLEIVRGQD